MAPFPNDQPVDSLLDELEQRIAARLTKATLGLVATIVALALTGAASWYGLVGRVQGLEVWKSERTRTLEDYHSESKDIGERLARIEAILEEMRKNNGN